LQIGFKVTAKGGAEVASVWKDLKDALKMTWPHVLYYVSFTCGVAFMVTMAGLGR